MTRYGYARVSTREQNPDSQWDALTAAGGSLEYVSPTNGARRVGASIHLAHYPMAVVVAKDSDVALAGWYRQAINHGIVLAFLLLILGALGRVAAFGILVNMLVAIVKVHAQFGFFANWNGAKKTLTLKPWPVMDCSCESLNRKIRCSCVLWMVVLSVRSLLTF